MILLLHILIASATLGGAALSVIMPSATKIRITSILSGLTVISGTYLVLVQPARLVHACISGLICLGIAFFAIAAARRKLATESVKSLQ